MTGIKYDYHNIYIHLEPSPIQSIDIIHEAGFIPPQQEPLYSMNTDFFFNDQSYIC